jgi:rhodanese-related sulfurtransferase
MTAALLLTGLVLGAGHTQESLDNVRQKIASGEAVLVDVRELSEWEAGHLRDARLLELSKLRKGLSPEELAKVLPKGKPAYLHCKSGARCLLAGEILEQAGFEVRPLRPGYEDLLKAGFPKAEK